MKTKNILQILLFTATFLCASSVTAQVDNADIVPLDTSYNAPDADTTLLYYLKTYNGKEFFGYLVSMNSKEVILKIKDGEEISIPSYRVQQFRSITPDQITSRGEFARETLFSTRYMYSSNALPLKQGENYAVYHLFGPEAQFGLNDNFSAGVITTWLIAPVMFSMKYSFNLNENSHLAAGLLMGSGSYNSPETGTSVPFLAYTLGNRQRNINLSVGYGFMFGKDKESGRRIKQEVPVASLGGMLNLSLKASLIFDSMIISEVSSSKDMMYTYSIGVRVHTKEDRAFQFGFTNLFVGDNSVPVIPTMSWFKKI